MAVAGRRLRTNADGEVLIRVRPSRRARTVRVHASRTDLRSATAVVRVTGVRHARAARILTR